MINEIWKDIKQHFVDGFSILVISSILLGYGILLVNSPEVMDLEFWDRMIHAFGVGFLPAMILYTIFTFMLGLIKPIADIQDSLIGFAHRRLDKNYFETLRLPRKNEKRDDALGLVFAISMLYLFASLNTYYGIILG